MAELILFWVLISAAAVYDIKKRIVPDWIPCLMAAVSLIPPDYPSIAGACVCVPLFIAGITTGGIGGGDIKLTCACGLVLGFYRTFAGLFISLCLMTAYHVAVTAIRRIIYSEILKPEEQAYPLVPFLWIGMLLSILTI